MAKKDVSNTDYTPSQILTIVLYIAGIVLIAVLIWIFISPIIAAIVAAIIAYGVNLRKLIGRK